MKTELFILGLCHSQILLNVELVLQSIKKEALAEITLYHQK